MAQGGSESNDIDFGRFGDTCEERRKEASNKNIGRLSRAASYELQTESQA